MAEDDDKDLSSAIFIAPSERDPLRAVAEGGKPKRLARFYKTVTVAPQGQGFAVLLDGKPLRTPARAPLLAPSQALAEAIAKEWERQGEHVEPGQMPLTRLANSALDGVAAHMTEVEADAAKYAGSDLVCYRAGDPAELVDAQREAWDPLLAFLRDRHGARFSLSEGVIHHAQPPETLEAMARLLHETVGDGPAAPFRLAGIHAMTTLSGSLVVALAVAMGQIEAEAGFAAAHVDEDYQLRVWGDDAEALARRARRLEEMRAAALCVALSS
jgi:chaperone required for assembly of F1-ATPase